MLKTIGPAPRMESEQVTLVAEEIRPLGQGRGETMKMKLVHLAHDGDRRRQAGLRWNPGTDLGESHRARRNASSTIGWRFGQNGHRGRSDVQPASQGRRPAWRREAPLAARRRRARSLPSSRIGVGEDAYRADPRRPDTSVVACPPARASVRGPERALADHRTSVPGREISIPREGGGGGRGGGGGSPLAH